VTSVAGCSASLSRSTLPARSAVRPDGTGRFCQEDAPELLVALIGTFVAPTTGDA